MLVRRDLCVSESGHASQPVGVRRRRRAYRQSDPAARLLDQSDVVADRLERTLFAADHPVARRQVTGG